MNNNNNLNLRQNKNQPLNFLSNNNTNPAGISAQQGQFINNTQIYPVNEDFKSQPDYDIQREFEKPISKWGDRTWYIVAVALCCSIVIFAGVVLASVFSGIAAFDDCPDCVCPIPLVSQDAISAQKTLENYEAVQATLLEKLTEGKEFGYKRCVSRCHENFVVCPGESDPEKCKARSGITEDCDDLSLCLDKCNQLCPYEEHKNVIPEDDKCLNKYNFFEICPSAEEEMQ